MARFHIPIFLVTLALLAPVVVCVVPGTTVSQGDDCCKHMSAGCGDKQQMSECCTITVSDSVMLVTSIKAAAVDIHKPLPVSSYEVLVPQARSEGWPFERIADISPPVSPPTATTILRI